MQLASANASHPRPGRLRASAELWLALVQRDLRSRYRGSYFGWLWALVKPLVLLLVYGLVVGVFLGAAASIPEFMLFVFVGLIAWNLFSAIVNGCITSVVGSAGLVTKHSFPKILLPLASATVAIVDSLIQGVVLVIGYLLVGDWPTMSSLAYLLPSVIGVVLFGLALGLVLAAWNVYARDVGFLTDVALQVGFWLCPIVYSYAFIVRAAESYGASVEWVTRIYMLNPVTNGVLGFQRALWPPASTPEGAGSSFPGNLELRLVLLVVVSAALLAGAAALFTRLSRNFAQEL